MAAKPSPYTVTNSFKRGTMRTYSRAPKREFWSFAEVEAEVEGRPNPEVQQSATIEPVSKRLRTENRLERGGPYDPETQLPQDAEELQDWIIRHVSPQGRERGDRARVDDLSSKSAFHIFATVPSSPTSQSPAIFDSDARDGNESAMSSPPPQLTPPKNVRKPAFRVMSKKHLLQTGERREAELAIKAPEMDRALSENRGGALNIVEEIVDAKPPAKVKKLIQTQLDLGQERQKTCGECGLMYVPSNTEDSMLHTKYHKNSTQNTCGIDLGKGFLKKVELDECTPRTNPSKGRALGDLVVRLDKERQSAVSGPLRRVLEVVTDDLGAVPVEEESVWQVVEVPQFHGEGVKRWSGPGWDGYDHRYKVFLYLRANRCIGFCLAERIAAARRVMRSETGVIKREGDSNGVTTSQSSSITVGEKMYEGYLGISRIWVAAPMRRQGIAEYLLECARSNLIGGYNIPYSKIAFSQPTESGCRLAEKFFNTLKHPWMVYEG